MHSIVTTFRGAVIKVEVANFCAAMDTLIDQDGRYYDIMYTVHFYVPDDNHVHPAVHNYTNEHIMSQYSLASDWLQQ